MGEGRGESDRGRRVVWARLIQEVYHVTISVSQP